MAVLLLIIFLVESVISIEMDFQLGDLVSAFGNIPANPDILVCANASGNAELEYKNSAHKLAIVGMGNANSIIDENYGPLVVIFSCSDKSEFAIAVANVVTFLANNAGGRIWKPVFILLYPESSQLAENYNYRQDPLFLPLFVNVVDCPVYVLHATVKFRNSNPTTSFLNSKRYLLVEIYSLRNQTIIRKVFAHQKQRDFNHLYFITSRRSNFEKATVVGLGMDDPNFPLSTKFKPNRNEFDGGFDVEMFRYLRDALNFTEASIKGTGYIRKGPNGTLTGQAIQINKNDADVGIGSTEFLEYRMKGPSGITYIHTFFHVKVFAYFKQPPASSIRNIFTQPFSIEFWVVSIIIWGTIVLTLKLSVGTKRKYIHGHKHDTRISEESLIWAFGVICQKSWYRSPYSASIRIVFITGILTGLISYIAYSAELISILSVEVVPIRVFDDLLKTNTFISSDRRIPSSKVFVEDLEDAGRIPKLGDGVRNIDFAKSFPELMNGQLAVVTIPDSFYPVVQQNYTNGFICDTLSFRVVSRRPVKSSCFVKRGSPLREFFNYKILQLQERGIKTRLINNYLMETSVQCLRRTGKFQTQLGLKDLFSAFLVILFGISSSVCFVLLEKFKLSFKRMKW